VDEGKGARGSGHDAWRAEAGGCGLEIEVSSQEWF